MIALTLCELSFALVVTIFIEVLVAGAFGVGRRGLLATGLVSVVTNPMLNLTVGYVQGTRAVDNPSYANILLVAAELLVVVIEWRLLLWALRATAGSPRRLLGLSISMNLASAVGLTVLLQVVALVARIPTSPY